MIWNKEMERLDRKEMSRLQSERLRDAVERAYQRIPVYKQRMDEAGVKPADIRGIEDLTKLPFIKKQDLRDNYPTGMIGVPMEELNRIHASSGTKGKPTVVGYTRADLQMWAEVCARAFFLAGGRPTDLFHNAYGYGLFTGGLGIHTGAELAGAAVVPVSGGNTPRQLLMMQDFRPRGIAATPSYALNLADAMQEAGIDPRTSSWEYGMFGAEPWSDAMRNQLEDRLNLKAVDVYGLSEIVGPGVSCECSEKQNGLHVQEDHFLPEILDPKTLQPVADGQFGELVFTTLTKQASAVIRYRTGDISALYHEPCSCGRTTVRMNRLKGRADDMLIIRGVNVFPSEVEFVLLQYPELAPHYQLIVDRSRALDNVEVVVEPSDAVLHAWGGIDPERPEVQELQGRLVARLNNALGVHMKVTLAPRGAVPRSEGKAIRVVDRRVM